MLARIVIADPPWPFKDKLPGKKRGAAKHYKCMTIPEIMRMPLPPISDSAVLFLWRVSSMVEEAYQVARVWGFTPKSEIVWNKTVASDPTGEKDSMGMGRIVRGSHETCIVAARGAPIETASKRERTSFRAPIGAHSEKPEEFYQKVERLYPLELWPEAHVELFARRRRKGWIQFGDELPAEEQQSERACVIHGGPAESCRACSVTAAGVRLRTLLASNGWRGTNWKDIRGIVDRDEASVLAGTAVESSIDGICAP